MFPAGARAPHQPQGATECHHLQRGGDRRPSLRSFLEVLTGNALEYDSDGIDCYALPHMCFHIDGEDAAKEAPELTPSD